VDQDDSGTPLERFLAEAALLTGQDKTVGTEGGVTLMTMHTAKGLEWRCVAVAGLEDGLFPLARSLESLDALEEERRLFYVALTRAKDKLYLSWARSRRRGGEIRPGMPSRFLRDIPPGVLEEKRTSSLWAPPTTGSGLLGGARAGSMPWFREKPAAPAVRPAIADEELSQDAPRYIKGERVRHRRFGSGTIEGLSGAGKDLKVSVRFDQEEVGVKQLLVAYAGLEREWEGA
jgi:DNA helicase-2/ATP-dependent DNA helicase PcrA